MPLRLCTIVSLAVLTCALSGATAAAQGNGAPEAGSGGERVASDERERREARIRRERRRSEDGHQLYAPFPEPAVRSRAGRYVSILDVSGISAGDLREGVFVAGGDGPRLEAAPRGEASERAAVTGGLRWWEAWLALASLALLLTTAALRVSGFRRPAD